MNVATANESSPQQLLVLPEAPSHMVGPVKVWREAVSMLTYEPLAANRNPMFLEKRVYQGSSGRVYPLPFIDRISTEPTDRLWDAVHIENEYVRLMILPELGGRIHVGYDKIAGYDFFYRQNVIKPALVGLAGPWISGGVEFNWPQHHRPATFMPVNTAIEEHEDGSATVWCSDHDPLLRMKGMHGVCLHPGRTTVEVKVRLYNRTQSMQTFLWWANVAVQVHEDYQSFFPTDVRYVADHAKRAITSFPRGDGTYYGVDYGSRGREGVPEAQRPRHFSPTGDYPPDDLSWYANIPVPTSYMITGTQGEFFGGYDHRRQAGLVHLANHHIAPGKKQWTWGNHEFGYAWDRNLTDGDGPYIELMAGVYTDNQPDFSFLAPWETKTFKQSWYPIRGMGVPQAANEQAALHLQLQGTWVELAVCVTEDLGLASVELRRDGKTLGEWTEELRVTETYKLRIEVPQDTQAAQVSALIRVGGQVLLAYDPATITPAKAPEIATEPLAPEQISTVEELYLTGLHLEQYRHATRQPELYWLEALRRDPGESRSLSALGRWHLRRGELGKAIERFKAAVTRLTRLNPNPYDGEAHLNLGVALRFQGDEEEAYGAFYKATWNAACRAPAYFALAELDLSRNDWLKAEDHLRRTLRAEGDHLNARSLLAFVRGMLGHREEAETITAETLRLDPLDVSALWHRGRAPRTGQEILDLAFDMIRSGRRLEATEVLKRADVKARDGSVPIILLVLADVQRSLGDAAEPISVAKASAAPRDYCFPNRIEEMLVLERTATRYPHEPLSLYLLGNFLYDRRRYEEAISAWEAAAALDPTFPTVWRNLGIAYFNVRREPESAVQAYERAFECDPADARILYEQDQLWKRTVRTPEERLGILLKYGTLVEQRDDLSVEMATLYNQIGRPEEALTLLQHRHFQPWEGGEGLVLGQYVRSRVLLGQNALDRGESVEALGQFQAALRPPLNLSEAKHPLSNQSEVYFWIGCAFEANRCTDEAREWYLRAANQKRDFQQMCIRGVSAMTYWSGRALQRLGKTDDALATFTGIAEYADELERTRPQIDYFATSLPSMLLFEEDLAQQNRINASFLRAQAFSGLGDSHRAADLLRAIVAEDASHQGAHDLLQLQGRARRVVAG